MGTTRLGVFPSLNNGIFQDEIAKSVMNWFIQRFSVGFFNHIYLDTQTGTANQYLVNKETGKLTEYKSGQKILQPSLRIIIKRGGNNPDDVFGSLWNVNQQPGAFAIDTDLTGYKPFCYGTHGIILATNEYTIRNQLEINVNLQTKADQLAFCNIADTNLKNLYVNVFEVDTYLPLPNLLMEYIRSCVFKPELLAMEKMKSDNTEYRQKVNDNFSKYLYAGSGGAIKPFKEFDNNNLKSYMYRLNRHQRITLRLNKYDADDGEKKGGVYTSWNVSFTGYIEYANPVSILTSVPAIIRGTKNDWCLRTSSNTDDRNYYSMIKFKEVFKDDRKLKLVDGRKFFHFYFESELLMSAATEDFNLIDDIIVEEDTPTHYYVAKALIDVSKKYNIFDSLFHVNIYKGNEPLDRREYSIDKDFNFHIENCDLSIPYYIDIFVNKQLYEECKAYMIKQVEKVGIELNWDESNRHSLREPITKYNRGKYYLLKSFEANSKDGRVTERKVFVPIKKSDFLIADTNFDYYIEVNEKFIPVENEIVEKRSDLDFYIKDPSSGNMLEIDRSKILIPDQSFDYYTYDRNTDLYKKSKKLNKFEDLQQYYIPEDQFIQTNVDIDNKLV